MPINPDYIESITEDEAVFRNYEGKLFRYPLKSTPRRESGQVEVQPEAVPSSFRA